jgi:hypothetical protein
LSYYQKPAILPYVLFLVTAAMLVGARHHRTQYSITHFDRLCKLEKRGDEIKNKSSPLKLLSQSQPNFAEIILRWSSFKIVSVSDGADGHNLKRGPPKDHFSKVWLKLAQ